MSGTLSRSTLGRLAAHTASAISGVSTAFDAGDWTGINSVTPSVSSGNLVTIISGAISGRRGVRYNAVEPGANHFVVAYAPSGSGNIYRGIYSRLASPFNDTQVNNHVSRGQAGNAERTLRARVSGTVTDQSATSGNGNDWAGAVSFGLETTGTDSRSLMRHATDTPEARSLSGLHASITGTWVGLVVTLGTGGSAETWSAFAVMRSAAIRVEGPDVGGWVVRLRDGSGTLLWTSAPQSGGVATIDLLDPGAFVALVPQGVSLAAQIEVYDPDGASVLAGPVSPSERVWGGDEWEWEWAATPTTPATPAAPTVTAVTMTSVALSWDAVEGATSYVVLRSSTLEGTYVPVATPTGTSHLDSGLVPSTSYFYRLSACNAEGCSDPSTATPTATTAPVPPDDREPRVARPRLWRRRGTLS